MLNYSVKDLSCFSFDDYKYSFSLMDTVRKDKILRLKNPMGQKSSLAGELLVRKMLSQYTGKPLDSFIIKPDEKGKPFCENFSHIHFNISHSNGKIAAAICNVPIGIDIETVRSLSLKIAKKCCSEKELLYVFGCLPTPEYFNCEPVSEVAERFLDVWTTKEAYFKCIGTGITNFSEVDALSDSFNKTKIKTKDYILHIVTLKS